jgi:hypothetical protein
LPGRLLGIFPVILIFFAAIDQEDHENDHGKNDIATPVDIEEPTHR